MTAKRYVRDDDAATVTFDPARCLHAARCVKGLPAVFDTAKRPWIQPGNAEVDALAEVIARCPSGALHLERADGTVEAPERPTSVRRHGHTIVLRGELAIELADGSVLDDVRATLCGCGHSGNQPFCDAACSKRD
ncbi:(4Fe-4S)-binding protein [Patulibacter defluvii]|uniref:(4Fe-4S)-binding protein n=1 Tax=Patulibacter defluvii TaxID=3095358 RepID=UPI002A74B919|nr:(4Fe-4S)-binding protein [Patulibacter sp. DM4]